jgi:hypothetical protein
VTGLCSNVYHLAFVINSLKDSKELVELNVKTRPLCFRRQGALMLKRSTFAYNFGGVDVRPKRER